MRSRGHCRHARPAAKSIRCGALLAYGSAGPILAHKYILSMQVFLLLWILGAVAADQLRANRRDVILVEDETMSQTKDRKHAFGYFKDQAIKVVRHRERVKRHQRETSPEYTGESQKELATSTSLAAEANTVIRTLQMMSVSPVVTARPTDSPSTVPTLSPTPFAAASVAIDPSSSSDSKSSKSKKSSRSKSIKSYSVSGSTKSGKKQSKSGGEGRSGSKSGKKPTKSDKKSLHPRSESKHFKSGKKNSRSGKKNSKSGKKSSKSRRLVDLIDNKD